MNRTQKLRNITRWTARITGSLLLAFILFFAGTHYFFSSEDYPSLNTTSEQLIFICYPVSVIVGLIIALRWEGLGGLITVVGVVGLHLLRPDIGPNLFIDLNLLPGLLYLAYWAMGVRQAEVF